MFGKCKLTHSQDSCFISIDISSIVTTGHSQLDFMSVPQFVSSPSSEAIVTMPQYNESAMELEQENLHISCVTCCGPGNMNEKSYMEECSSIRCRDYNVSLRKCFNFFILYFLLIHDIGNHIFNFQIYTNYKTNIECILNMNLHWYV